MKVIFLAVLCGACFFYTPSKLCAEQKRYRVAIILPLSGQFASLGNYVKNGIDLALSELPLENRDKLEIVFEDDQFNPTSTISAYHRINSLNKVNSVWVIGSPTANALSPITERDKTILMAIGASDGNITRNKDYAFIHWVTPDALGDKLVEAILKKGLKRLALVVAEVDGAIAAADGVSNALERAGQSGLIVYRQNFLKTETDFRTALLRIRQRQVDTVVVVLFPGGLSAFAKQFKAAQISAELVGLETFEDEAEIKASQGALIGAWYANAAGATEEFVNSYQNKYGQHPGWAAANGYDTVKLMASAVAQVGFDNDKIRYFLRSVKDYRGAAGVYSASDKNSFTIPASLKIVTKESFQDYNP